MFARSQVTRTNDFTRERERQRLSFRFLSFSAKASVEGSLKIIMPKWILCFAWLSKFSATQLGENLISISHSIRLSFVHKLSAQMKPNWLWCKSLAELTCACPADYATREPTAATTTCSSPQTASCEQNQPVRSTRNSVAWLRFAATASQAVEDSLLACGWLVGWLETSFCAHKRSPREATALEQDDHI